MGFDPRIGDSFLSAGIGFGGSCFPKDVSALKQLAGNSGYHFQLLTAVIEVNELQKRRVVSKLQAATSGSLVGKEIALLGLAFKPHTDDMREASSVVLAARLQGEGALVRAYDPVAEEARRRAAARRRDVRLGARRRRGRGRGRDRHRMAGVRASSTWQRCSADGQPGDRRRPQHAGRRRGARPPASSTRASAGPSAGGRELLDAGTDPRGGRGHAAAPAHHTVPKPVLPLANRPFISYMVDWLAGHGFDDVVMSCGFLADGCARCWARRARDGLQDALRRGARAARHRRRRQVRARTCSTSASRS